MRHKLVFSFSPQYNSMENEINAKLLWLLKKFEYPIVNLGINVFIKDVKSLNIHHDSKNVQSIVNSRLKYKCLECEYA